MGDQFELVAERMFVIRQIFRVKPRGGVSPAGRVILIAEVKFQTEIAAQRHEAPQRIIIPNHPGQDDQKTDEQHERPGSEYFPEL